MCLNGNEAIDKVTPRRKMYSHITDLRQWERTEEEDNSGIED